MNKKFSLDMYHFTGSDTAFKHWISPLRYTEGVRYLAEETESYWLIDTIAFVIFPRLLKENKDWFYSIEFSVNRNGSAVMSVSDGNGNMYLKHSIKWTDFPYIEKPVKFFLCESEVYYCLMLPSEY